MKTEYLKQAVSAMRACLDNAPEPGSEEMDPETEEMFETMQSAWEEASRVLNDLSVNTEVSYMYRDGANYKTNAAEVVKGRITPSGINRILEACCGDDFIPGQVGLPGLSPRIDDEGYDAELDHPWHELFGSESFQATDKHPTVNMTMNELIAAFEKAEEDGWGENM